MAEQANAERFTEISRSIDRVAEAIKHLADMFLYVNQPEDEPGFEGQSLSDREHL